MSGESQPRGLSGETNFDRDSLILPPIQPLESDYGLFRPQTRISRISTVLIQLTPPTLQKLVSSTDY